MVTQMEQFKLSKVIPNVIDIVLFIFIALSIYFKNYPAASYTLLAIPCIAMWALIVRQVVDCWKQKSVYNFTMLVTAVNTKLNLSNKLVSDVIIYGLHIYLYTLNPNYIYLVSFGICLAYDLMIYNASFNPLMKRYIMNTVMRQVEESQSQKSE